MKKKTSLINLTNTEIKKNELKETLAGQHSGKGSGKRFTYSGGGDTGLLAAAQLCGAWCTCSCEPEINIYSHGDAIGFGNAYYNWQYGIIE